MTEQYLLDLQDVTVEYDYQGLDFAAVEDVSFGILKGETLGLVGESGCGKSSIGKSIIQLPPPTKGKILFEGKQLSNLSNRALQRMRHNMQIIFQDPVASLNPRRKVRNILSEPLIISGVKEKKEIEERVRFVLNAVSMNPDTTLDKRPHEFSGGQCQRICIARALILEPKFIVCDEPVSSLDVSIQAQILNLLEDLKRKYDLTLLFISHDLAVVKNISDRVAVMYLGKLCEIGASMEIYEKPLHPYTHGLIGSVPSILYENKKIRKTELIGETPSLMNPPSGCRFRTRCSRSEEKCENHEPDLREIRKGQFVACHFPLEY